MKLIPSRLTNAAAVCAFLALAVTGLSPLTAFAAQYNNPPQGKDQSRDKGKQNAPSDGEQKAMAQIQAAPNVAAKLQEAGEFVKKYPKSSLRPKVVSYVAQEISHQEDAAQKATQLEGLLAVFKEPADSAVIEPILVDSCFAAGRLDDGFRVGAAYLAKNPDDLAVLTQIALEGANQAKKQNPKFVPQSQQYGPKAIALIESGKRPEAFDDVRWSEFQTRWLPILYQNLGMLALMTGNKADARAKLDKALSLDATDPFSFVLVGSILNDEYQQLAQQHTALTPGPLKDSVLKQAHSKMDEVIDVYAHAVGLAEGKPAYQALHDQLLQDLKAYYTYRHGGSADGLQTLIDKFKKP